MIKNLACIGIQPGVLVTEKVIAQVGCLGKSIIEFVTSSPIGMTKSVIQNPSTGELLPLHQSLSLIYTNCHQIGIFQITVTWTPTAAQYGPQGLCAGALDNTNVQSEQWCITYLVGFDSPDIIRPTAIQGSASPLGTIFQNHSVFSIQSKCMRTKE